MTTLASKLTGDEPAAIAVIGLSGEHAPEIVSRLFADGKPPAVGRLRFGMWRSLDKDADAEHIVLCRVAEEDFELNCHGGPAICRRILSDLEQCGCKLVHRDEWPAESADPILASLEIELSRAVTLGAARFLMMQYDGRLRLELLTILALVEQGNLLSAIDRLEKLGLRGRQLQAALRPPRLIMAGPPNVGKSSLTNALFGDRRVLVHHEAGTTRDAVEVPIVVDGWPLMLVDTAGVREAQELVEVLGVEKALAHWQSADLALLIVDQSQGWTSVHDELMQLRTLPVILVWNKCDLFDLSAADPLPVISDPARFSRVVSASAIGAPGIDGVLAAIAEKIHAMLPDATLPLPINEIQCGLVDAARRALNEHQGALAVKLLKSLMGA
ncbi:MAG: GTPase [Pirellulales bacterium]